VWDAERFAFHVDWARRLGMVGCWPVFHAELQAAVTLACGLSEPRTPTEAVSGLHRIGGLHRRLEFLLLDIREVCDPTVEWDTFRELLWVGAQHLPHLHASRGLPAPPVPPLEPLPPCAPAKPGVPLAIVPLFERTAFQLATTDAYRSLHTIHWDELTDRLQVVLDELTPAVMVDSGTRPSPEVGPDPRRAHTDELLRTVAQRFDPVTQWEEAREWLWIHRPDPDLTSGGPSVP
jgi:hypothetical protein